MPCLTLLIIPFHFKKTLTHFSFCFPYLGLAGLTILALLLFFCLRKRRKDEFDGNFDPAYVSSAKGGGGGGTLPDVGLRDGDMLGNDGGGRGVGEVEEDDGMGGRLGSGVGGGGIIMPYAFKPSTPIGGGGQQYQNQQQMQQMGNLGATASGPSGYQNEKRAMRQYSPNSNPGYPQQQQQMYATAPLTHTPTHSTALSISSGSYYPTTLASSTANLNPANNPNYIPNQYPLSQNSTSPEPFATMSDRSSSTGGVGGGGYFQGQGMMPRGGSSSPGQSVLGSSSGGGGRNAKEMEAMGRVVANPDDRVPGGQQGQQQQYGQFPAFQAYLQNGPGPHQQQQQQQQQQQYHPSSSSSTPVPSQATAGPGTAVVVHEDGGRVVLRKGGDAEGETEADVLSPEIPPTYDSLPAEVRRDS